MYRSGTCADIIFGKSRIIGENVSSVAKRCGIAPSTMYRRLKDPDTFTIGELKELIRVLRLSDDEVLYFVGGGHGN